MWQATAAAREAARAGNYGKVVREARHAQGVTQRQLAQACGVHQSRISRQLEQRGRGPYQMDLLRAAAAFLGVPLHLVGLAESHSAHPNGAADVNRRAFLRSAAAAATTPLAGFPEREDGLGQQVAALRVITSASRRLDAGTPSRDLSESVHGHLRLIQTIASSAGSGAPRQRLAEAASEAASFAGWLAWDMADLGSARTWYGQAVRAAKASGNPLLVAYQAGTLAQFEAHAGNPHVALNHVADARRRLADDTPDVADAWLLATEALAHAVSGDARACDRTLATALAAARRSPKETPPPWPWVFSFDETKVAAHRLTCAARLGRPDWATAEEHVVLAIPNEKQRALALLDLAASHIASGRPESGWAMAGQAVRIGVKFRSGRIVERGRAVRRLHNSRSVPRAVGAFDDLLHNVHL
ncbi:helix-turn-helix domain-containing protein [Kitasatospora sp. NPDC048365]|uniref:helix-turn-helix domain-containing protein n=1 Tax=Kitasatospora sp. NPDC048365 TaxID=3364050 RepID=UPI00371D6463